MDYLHLTIAIWITLASQTAQEGILYPRESETREILSLDGIWNFAVSSEKEGYTQEWYKTDLTKLKDVDAQLMPVPSSYNDIVQNITIRDYVGEVWYDRTFFVPKSWSSERVWLRISAVNYAAQVWVNGKMAMSHEIGYLPFKGEVTSLLNYGGNNRVTIVCDNTLNWETIPQGTMKLVMTDEGPKHILEHTFGYVNNGGIARPVTLYTTPNSYIDDVTINTNISGTNGLVHYEISYVNSENVECVVTIVDKEENVVVEETTKGNKGTLMVPSAKLWWPYLMHPNPGYMYTLQVELRSPQGETIDMYRQPFGIRTISWNSTSVLVNNRPMYFHGFGRHEDADIRGKGMDLPTIVRDHDLIKWMGANVYRTSHYPYAEETMDIADQLGIMIVDECSAIDTTRFSLNLLRNHMTAMTELIQRDKNRPAVVMWSISNEPQSDNLLGGVHFGQVVKHVKKLDATRPVTIAIPVNVMKDWSAQFLDVISINRYNGWYSNAGHLDMIVKPLIEEMEAWHKRFNKPVLMAEYGADTAPGLHDLPAFIWTEDYQVAVLQKHFEGYDILRAKGWFIGEFVWNFANFKMPPHYQKIGGTKGVFTRDRQPKQGAHCLRYRYWKLSSELYNVSMPHDLQCKY